MFKEKRESWIKTLATKTPQSTTAVHTESHSSIDFKVGVEEEPYDNLPAIATRKLPPIPSDTENESSVIYDTIDDDTKQHTIPLPEVSPTQFSTEYDEEPPYEDVYETLLDDESDIISPYIVHHSNQSQKNNLKCEVEDSTQEEDIYDQETKSKFKDDSAEGLYEEGFAQVENDVALTESLTQKRLPRIPRVPPPPSPDVIKELMPFLPEIPPQSPQHPDQTDSSTVHHKEEELQSDLSNQRLSTSQSEEHYEEMLTNGDDSDSNPYEIPDGSDNEVTFDNPDEVVPRNTSEVKSDHESSDLQSASEAKYGHESTDLKSASEVHLDS